MAALSGRELKALGGPWEQNRSLAFPNHSISCLIGTVTEFPPWKGSANWVDFLIHIFCKTSYGLSAWASLEYSTDKIVLPPSRPPMIPPRIAIVGAGPAGCTLAHLLHKSGIRATVFEGEVGLDYRSQGGTLDLHTTTGLAAVKAAGLWDEFLRHARYDGDYTLFVDKDMKTFFKRAGPATPKSDSAPRLDEQRPEIDRAALRQLLVDGSRYAKKKEPPAATAKKAR
ncbi:hypothetical protein VTK73DRAFT_6073 [Phialemonium thermophilum]|uniref:FAD-binding domain-containing protein n=1 Tax=Phialemonium thermophilum TaxID=223376 RepID=A0ABR3V030_9PEZI